jgi:hypothetical protein
MVTSPLEATLRELESVLQTVLLSETCEEEDSIFVDKLSSFRVALRRADASLALSNNTNGNSALEPDAAWLQHRFAENRALSLAAEDLALRFRKFTLSRRRNREATDGGGDQQRSRISTSTQRVGGVGAVTMKGSSSSNIEANVNHDEDTINRNGGGSSSSFLDLGTAAMVRRRRREEEAASEAAERAELLKRLPKNRDSLYDNDGSVEFLKRAVAGMQDNANRAISSTRLVSNDGDAMRRTLQHHASLSGGMSEGANRVRAHKNKASRDRLVLYVALSVLVLVAAYLSSRRLLWTFLGVELRIL